MKSNQPVDELTLDTPREGPDQEARRAEVEIRAFRDLEAMLGGGGADASPCW